MILIANFALQFLVLTLIPLRAIVMKVIGRTGSRGQVIFYKMCSIIYLTHFSGDSGSGEVFGRSESSNYEKRERSCSRR